jgi:16S rRNA processing protein RimM
VNKAGAAPLQRDAGEYVAPPSDLIALGVVTGAYGLQGWVWISPFSEDAATLLGTKNWWLQRAGHKQPLALTASKKHGAALLAKWPGSESPEAADALKGALIAVSRAEFPTPRAGEFYWQDLIGARVVNRAGSELGTVTGLRNNGAQDLLEIAGSDGQILVPMIDRYVDRVDLQDGTVRVDWEVDW